MRYKQSIFTCVCDRNITDLSLSCIHLYHFQLESLSPYNSIQYQDTIRVIRKTKFACQRQQPRLLGWGWAMHIYAYTRLKDKKQSESCYDNSIFIHSIFLREWKEETWVARLCLDLLFSITRQQTGIRRDSPAGISEPLPCRRSRGCAGGWRRWHRVGREEASVRPKWGVWRQRTCWPASAHPRHTLDWKLFHYKQNCLPASI